MTAEKLYYFYVGIETMLWLWLIIHYIYLEPGMKSNVCRIWYTGGFLTSLAVSLSLESIPEDMYILVPFLFLALYILTVRQTKRIRGMFLVIPAAGMILALASFASSISYLITKDELSDVPVPVSLTVDAVFWLILIIFWFGGKNWRANFKREMQFRHLKRWERILLNVTGTFLFILSVLLICAEDILKTGLNIRFFLTAGNLSAVLLEIIIIAMVVQGNKKDYYYHISEMNEHYLKAELAHFQAYRQTQTEMRKVRHDMKNHLAVLNDLADKGRYDALKNYLAKLGSLVHQTESEIHCGNDIADAILNEKNLRASKAGIKLSIDGRFPCEGLNPVDTCTILSNALDNAIEAVEASQIKDKWIQVSITRQDNMLLLTFENPVESGCSIKETGITDKKDISNHGFGLLNIQSAVQKYMGQISRKIESRHMLHVYCLEIILFLTG